MEKEFITTKEVAEYLGYSVAYVRRLCSNRQIPFYKMGHKVLFSIKEIQEYAHANYFGTIPQTIV